MFHFAIVGAQRGFSSSVLLVLGGAFVHLFNVVLVARLDLFHLQSCWCSTGLLFICLMSCWWLDSIYFLFGPVGARRDCCLFVKCRVGGSTRFILSSVLLVLDGTVVYLFLLVLVGVQQRFRRYETVA